MSQSLQSSRAWWRQNGFIWLKVHPIACKVSCNKFLWLSLHFHMEVFPFIHLFAHGIWFAFIPIPCLLCTLVFFFVSFLIISFIKLFVYLFVCFPLPQLLKVLPCLMSHPDSFSPYLTLGRRDWEGGASLWKEAVLNQNRVIKYWVSATLDSIGGKSSCYPSSLTCVHIGKHHLPVLSMRDTSQSCKARALLAWNKKDLNTLEGVHLFLKTQGADQERHHWNHGW